MLYFKLRRTSLNNAVCLSVYLCFCLSVFPECPGVIHGALQLLFENHTCLFLRAFYIFKDRHQHWYSLSGWDQFGHGCNSSKTYKTEGQSVNFKFHTENNNPNHKKYIYFYFSSVTHCMLRGKLTVAVASMHRILI